ncbi:efflux RND transporter periplasmic adaptor subunit [soil metagenome]|nr:efflux RND transporter periplasmic adaptor subunit [Gemmatimonadota bacterium]
MKTRKIGFGAFAGLVLAAGLSGCGGTGEAAESEPPEAASARVISVEVEPVQLAAFTEFVRIVGNVAANRDVTISAEESGVVRQLYVDKGAHVRAGQPIARIDDQVLRAQMERATAQFRLAEETWERQRRLWEDEKIGSEINYLNAKYNAQTAKASANELRARMERTVVRSPISGVLDARMVEVGSMVSPGAPVARVVDTETVKVSGGLPERYAADVTRGSEMRVGFDALGSTEFMGKVQFVGATLNEQSRTIPIEVTVPNSGGVIRPGMVANLQVARRATEGAILVPQQAVLRRENGYVVYVAVDRDGGTVAEVRDVIPGVSESGRVVIEQGLQPGDRVVTVGQQQVSAGDRLRIVNG